GTECVGPAVRQAGAALVAGGIGVGGGGVASGGRIPSIFAKAGSPAPSVGMTTIVGAGANSHAVVQRMANLVVSLLPKMQRHDLIAPDEVDPQTLARRTADDVTASASFIAARSEGTANSRRRRHEQLAQH